MMTGALSRPRSRDAHLQALPTLPDGLPGTVQAEAVQQECHALPVILEALDDTGVIAHNSVHGVPLIAAHILQSQQPPPCTRCHL